MLKEQSPAVTNDEDGEMERWREGAQPGRINDLMDTGA